MSFYEKISMYDPNCQDLTDEEIAEYIDNIRIQYRHPKVLDLDNKIELKDKSHLQKQVNSEKSPQTYNAPWDYYTIDYEPYTFGVANVGWEGGVDAYQGWCNIAAAAGPGIGESWGTVWITHGIFFQAPVTDIYSITFDYTIQGWVKGGITWIDAVASSEVALFFMAAGETIRNDILYEQTIPIAYHQYEKYFYEDVSLTMEVQLYKDNYYWILAQGAQKGRAVGLLLDFAYSYNHLNDEGAGGWGDGAVLNSVTIDWSDNPPNNPPNKPNTPSGPESGIINKLYTYTTSAIDPDGDNLYYKWDWGDGPFSNWLGPYSSGETVSASHSWTESGIYAIRVKAKDVHGAESEWSEPLPILMPLSHNYQMPNFLTSLYRDSLLNE